MTNRKTFLKAILIMMVALIGFGFIGSGVTYAEFIDNTPINGKFNENIANTSTATEKGWLESAGDWISDTFNDVTDWCSETWDSIWTSIKDFSIGVWDYIMENKVLSVIVLTILGILAVIAGILIGIPLLVAGGVGSLAGMGIMGLVSWLSSDNGFMSDGMLKDMIIGGLGGILSAPLGEWIAGSKLATWIASKINISWLQSAFPRIFGGSVAGGADQGIMDFLSSGKFNWKNLLVAMALGGSVVGGGSYVATHLDDVG
ncbi:hypothetical protein [Thermoactinomyces sp. DSM 45892]|uniref:hypothetical protein n=1 Tax=Thermoactinomyces sp. DSM 45892 TaxID=1882753 RepID=UPI0011608FD6|nr:hypothetical protein [Thermoactinomyces sp. DSM 45892]